jgi:hypothetical protein
MNAVRPRPADFEYFDQYYRAVREWDRHHRRRYRSAIRRRVIAGALWILFALIGILVSVQLGWETWKALPR